MAKRMLADVLWNAANDHLSVPHTYGDAMYSCCAVGCASEAAGLDYRAAFPFLTELGCRCDSYCPEMYDSQGVRYMWLLLAMHVAEDEGIEV